MFTANGGIGGASHSPAVGGVESVDDALDVDRDDVAAEEDADAAVGRLESLLQAASGTKRSVVQASTRGRRLAAIGAVFLT
jgi:hypothetical protein